MTAGQVFNGSNSGIGPGSWKELFSEFFPEFNDGLEKLQLKEHLILWLLEVEKFLRKMRLFFLKVDSFFESMIKKIRKVHLSSKMYSAAPIKSATSKEPALQPIVTKQKESSSQFDLFKKEEQRLIVEIAKNPKDPNLYEVLGDIYMNMQNFGDAKESYEAAVELNPGNAGLLKKRSQAVEKVVSQK